MSTRSARSSCRCILAISHAPIFGWAKPVPVNYRRLRNPRRDMVLVALAGPGMNLLLALLGAVVACRDACRCPPARTAWRRTSIAGNALNFVLINLFLAVFNLLPMPPFDGGHVVKGCCRRRSRAAFARSAAISLLVLVVLLLVLPGISASMSSAIWSRRWSTGSPRAAGVVRRPRLTDAPRLDHPRQAGGPRLDDCGQRGQAHPARSGRAQDQGRPWRHARPARQRRAADRARRSDQARRPNARRDQEL